MVMTIVGIVLQKVALVGVGTRAYVTVRPGKRVAALAGVAPIRRCVARRQGQGFSAEA